MLRLLAPTAALRLNPHRSSPAAANCSLVDRLINDEAGFVISAELVLVATIGVVAMAVGLVAVRDATTHELNDVSHAVGAVSQSYSFTGLHRARGGWGVHACTNGAGFNDATDECDCKVVEFVDVYGKSDPSNGDAE